MTPKITLRLTRANGHVSTAATSKTAPPTPAMIASAEALLEFMSTGRDPLAACGTCGIRRDRHAQRHQFVEG